MQRYKEFITRVKSVVPRERIYTDELRRLAWGTDAGFYRYVPQVVVRSTSEAEVSCVLKIASELSLPVTFRAAGTSLSGQACTPSILVVAGKHWEGYEVLDGGKAIRLQPGIVGSEVDNILKPYGRLFTPDPASKNSAMVGGIVANNASGMSCGTHANSDRELLSARLVLADGTILDTGSEQSKEEFRRAHPHFVRKIEELREKVTSNAPLAQRIKRKYAIKNVTGLNLLPFVTFSDPFDIITHLVVGSEGTLAFGAEYTMKTGKLPSHRASAMLYFKEMRAACEAVVSLKSSPVHCAELLDKKSLASVDDTTGPDLTAVLVQTFADSEAELRSNIEAIMRVLEPFELYVPARFTSDPAEYGRYWAIRSGIFPSVGGTRPLGTTVLIEDIAFHIEDLPEATVDLAQLLVDYGYDDSCIYGHALEGNYHFIISQSFDSQSEIDRYEGLMRAVVELVVDKYDGSLKAEHGTGRNMAPFVEKEWGSEAYAIMKEVKQLFDPQNILNPGVIFNDDPKCYVSNLKPMPLTSEVVDRCIECGFCEVNCVSSGLGLSSRQRIVVQRELSRLQSSGEDDALLHKLQKQYHYHGDVVCAADGLCSTSCPMSINVGELTHRLRAAGRTSLSRNVGRLSARHFGAVKGTLKGLLYVSSCAGAVLGEKGTSAVGRALHAVGMPLWTPSMPLPRRKHRQATAQSDKKVVYFPSCINQTMGRSRGDGGVDLADEVVSLLAKAGWQVVYPEKMNSLCCGMIWESKGMPDVSEQKSQELEAALLRASENGRYPVVCDQSPCLHQMRQHFKQVKPLELIEFIHDYVSSSLDFHPTAEPVALHLTCSTRLMGIAGKVEAMARRCSHNVVVPNGVGCCGFAGDKGFTHPELNAWGLRKLRSQIEEAGVKRGFSNSRTCEIGLATNSGIPYRSLVFLINEVTTAKQESQK